MPEFADKWKVNDSWCKTLHYEGGNCDFVELHHIDSFARICELEGLNTIAEVCDKYPSLIPLISKKQIEIGIEELRTISKEARLKPRLTSSYWGLFPTGFDDHLCSLIASYAQQIEGVENAWKFAPCFPCIHMPIKEFFNEVSNRAMTPLDENVFLHLWEYTLITNFEVMRKLLESLLQAMGFSSVEEAEKKYPFIINEGIENFLDRLARNFDEAIMPLTSKLAYWRRVNAGEMGDAFVQDSLFAIVWYTNHIEMLRRFSTDRVTH